ncbi:TonB-dependent receptor [Aerophototrophica crusticola]|uniref:TonB-dependent receptor n=1 Tax=Aerophototrophica crusticola TaxID=1709002 RepID=UPI00384DA0A7
MLPACRQFVPRIIGTPMHALRTTTAALALLAAIPASAQGVEEIVVTARQRAEDPQRTPLSLTVLGPEAIERAQVDSIADIATRAPGLVVSDPFGRFNPAPAIRGLTQPGVGEEPSVGFFLDGVYVSGRSSINLFLDDVERIEVLKGPQNALFGRNTFGGAVNLVTRKPGDAVEGQVAGAIGNKGRKEFSASVGGPLVAGKLAARASFALDDYDGFYRNALAGGPEIGAEKSTAAALTLRATPTDRLEALLRVSYAEDRDGQPKGWWLQTNCQQRLNAAGVPAGAFTQYCGEIPEDVPTQAANAEHFGFRRDAWRTALTVNYDLGPATLTSISAANFETNEFNRDNDYSAALIARAGQLTDRHDWSQELRLVSNDDGEPLSWIAGASRYRFDNETERRDFDYVESRVRPGGGTRTAEVTDSWAVYGSLSYRLPLDLTATADLRWQRDEKRFATTALPNVGLSDEWTMWTPRFALSWQATDDALLYASAAKGAKSGGFSTMANILPTERSFDPETNWTYEVGAKTQWLGGRVTANAALFWIDWTDQQVVAVSSGPFTNNNFYTANAAQSRSRGLELELAAAPVEGLDLRAAYTFVDAEFRDYRDTDYFNIPAFAPDGDISGLALPRQSRHQIVASGQYTAALAAGWDGFLGGEWLWQSRQYTENSNLSWIPADGKVNAWVGLEQGGARFTLRVRNLFDDRSAPVAIRFNEPVVVAGRTEFRRAWLVTPADGRTWTVEARWRY